MKNLFRAIAIIATALACCSCNFGETEANFDFLNGNMEYTVPAEGGYVEINFECDKDWFTSVIVPITELENDWYAVEGMHGDAGEGYVKVTLKPNPRDTERTLEIQITADITKSPKIKITQLAKGAAGGGSIDEDDPSIDTAVEVLPYNVTAKSAYFKGVVACSAPAGYESTKPAIGFMISSEYSTVNDIYQYGKWYWPLSYKSTGDADNVYRIYVSDLAPATTYYVIACAEYKNDVSYKSSKVYAFTTATVSSNYNGHEYVDLGLSVKWAKCNVGAKDEYSVGGYYCWGETSTKSSYRVTDYKFRTGKASNGNPLYSKYVSSPSYGADSKVDNILCLEYEDDAARAQMGGTWRLPHDSELRELISKCTWERQSKTVDGETVYTAVKITGPNGNHIILPFGGNMVDDCQVLFINQGRYMGAELDPSNNSACCELYFTTGNIQNLSQGDRSGGLTIRAVTD